MFDVPLAAGEPVALVDGPSVDGVNIRGPFTWYRASVHVAEIDRIPVPLSPQRKLCVHIKFVRLP